MGKPLDLPLEGVGLCEEPTAQCGRQPEEDIAFDDFRWSDDNADVVVPGQPAIAVYLNPSGAIVIRQQSPFHDSDDPFIYIRRQNLRPLIERLLEIEAK